MAEFWALRYRGWFRVTTATGPRSSYSTTGSSGSPGSPGRSAAFSGSVVIGFLPEQSLEHLAGGIAGQHGPQSHLPGHLVVGQPLAAEGQHLRLVQLLAGPGHQVGPADLAQPRVGHPDDRRLGHAVQ